MHKEIRSKDHPLVKHWAHLKQNRDYRYTCHRVMIEGEKLVHDILHKTPFHHLILLDRGPLPDNYNSAHISVVSEEVMKKISGLTTPPAMMAEVTMPPPSDLVGKKWILALDRLQDPGNLGTLFRTAFALGWEGVYLIGDCVDLFNDKAQRASQGSSLLLPYQRGTLQEFEAFIDREFLPVYLADIAGKDPSSVERGCLVVGREGEGIHQQLKTKYPSFTIPMQQGVDSLNVAVAGGILLYTMRKA